MIFVVVVVGRDALWMLSSPLVSEACVPFSPSLTIVHGRKSCESLAYSLGRTVVGVQAPGDVHARKSGCTRPLVCSSARPQHLSGDGALHPFFDDICHALRKHTFLSLYSL